MTKKIDREIIEKLKANFALFIEENGNVIDEEECAAIIEDTLIDLGITY